MDRTIPLPVYSDRPTTFVLVTSLSQWKRMRPIKAWRAFGKGGMVMTVGFAASPEVLREMASEALRGWGRLPGVGWCVVRVDLTAQW